jgi:hypothetical protein
MENTIAINNMNKPRLGTQTEVRLSDYKFEIGQMQKGGKSIYMNLCAYVTHNDEISLSKHFSRLNERLYHFISKSSSELFKTRLNKKMPLILTHDHSNLKTKDVWTFFNIEMTLFFVDGQVIDDVRDELYLIGYSLIDWLEDEVPYLEFKSRK